jgi:hypothetical protein
MTEDVHIAPTSSNRSAYHTRECSHFPENAKTVTREQAERRGLEPCTYCEQSFEPANKQPEEKTIDWETDIEPPELEE